MSFTRRACLATLLAASAACGAAELSPQDFAYGLPVITTTEASAYRFALPVSVYRGTVRDDLADLRIFNAGGDVVPYSLLRPTPQALTHSPAVSLPVFPLRGSAHAVMNGLRLTVESSGSAVNLETQRGDRAGLVVNQYILDGRGVTSAISALQLVWPDTATDYSGRAKVEAGEDLDDWRTVVTAAPTANLHANGQALIENRITLPPTHARFWRLSWVGLAPAFELNAVMATPADGPAHWTHASLDVAGTSDAADRDVDTFDLEAHLPVTRFRVDLPEINTVNTIEMSSRRTSQDPWRTIAQAGFYRIKTADGEQQSAPLEIAPDRDRYWRARIVRGGAPRRSPVRLHVEWVPNEVTFLARGHAPFMLAFGSGAATAADSDLSQVPADMTIATATLGTQRMLGGESRLKPEPAPFSRLRIVLWGALLIAVLVLGWMAYRLSTAKTFSA